MSDRRDFIKKTAIAGVGTTLMLSGGSAWAFAPSETVRIAILGMGGRSYGLMEAMMFCQNLKIAVVCDVDQERLDKASAYVAEKSGYKAKAEKDFRKVLESKDVDAVIVATPEHWHAPMAIMGMQAGKHVYVEKPCSHNPHENELLNAAYKKYKKVCQMGNQQRSSVTSAIAIKDIRDGKIGDVYAAKAWYTNTRGSIGVGKEAPVPATLDWDLWQGPAPRQTYKDNVHPYNWHWFKAWGTGEIHNNGTHEIDICRWALGVDFPKRVVSSGGRLHFKNDDWEYYDTQLAGYEFEGGKTINWEGRSCNGMPFYNRGRGVLIHGTNGTILLDRGGYQLLDLAGKEISFQTEENPGTSTSTADTTGFDGLTVRHMQNFVNAILKGEQLNAPVDDGSISTQLCHLGNIAQHLQVSIDVDSTTGKVINNPGADAMWKRQYENGWEPKV